MSSNGEDFSIRREKDALETFNHNSDRGLALLFFEISDVYRILRKINKTEAIS